MTKGLWFAQMVPNYLYLKGERRFPLAFKLSPRNVPGIDDQMVEVTNNKLIMMSMNAVLATGVALKILTLCLRRHERVSAVQGPHRSSESNTNRGGWHRYAGSRVPSLLVGWGTAYWATSLFALSVCALHGDECGWHGAPIIVTAISYIIVPCVIFAGVLMVADLNILGKKFAEFCTPAVDILRNRAWVEYWVLSTVFRDFVVFWLGYCNYLRTELADRL